MAVIIIIVILIIFAIFAKTHKKPKMGDVFCVTGGVKTGKSMLSLHMARKIYKKKVFKWRLKNIFYKITFRKAKVQKEKPLFYSNIKLACPYVPLTKEIFLREERLNYGSVAFVDEASLLADSMDWKSEEVNVGLKMFNKLYGHETHGGTLVYNTHVMKDNHFAIKRVMNSYIWIHHTIKWIPFICIMRVREMFFSEDGEMINTAAEDVEKSLYWLIVPKSVWKLYDCYTYSVFTDNLKPKDDVKQGTRKNLKTDYIVELGGKKNATRKKVE